MPQLIDTQTIVKTKAIVYIDSQDDIAQLSKFDKMSFYYAVRIFGLLVILFIPMIIYSNLIAPYIRNIQVGSPFLLIAGAIMFFAFGCFISLYCAKKVDRDVKKVCEDILRKHGWDGTVPVEWKPLKDIPHFP